jgi:hypothetical protein
MYTRIRAAAVAAVIAAALFPGVAFGQEKAKPVTGNVGRISGRIADRRGESIRNQPVLLKAVKSTDPAIITSTDQDGMFTFPAIPAASYEVVLEVPGFKRMVVPATVTDGNTVNVGTVELEMAPIGDGIEVTRVRRP